MSLPSVTTSSSSKLNQFGLYRTIDERTEEFLKLSRRRQVRQGCVCAAISTAITVAIVVSVLLLYEYHIIGYHVPSRRIDKNLTEVLNDRSTGKYTKKLAILPSLLRVLSKDNQDNDENSKKLDPITQYQFKRDWIAELTRKVKTTNIGLEYKTSPIIFLKAPHGMLDFYSKAKEVKKPRNYKNAIGYIESNTVPTDYHHYESIMNTSKEKTKNSVLKVGQIFNNKPLAIEMNKTQSQDAIQHPKGCCCSKTFPELIKRLIVNIEQLIRSKVLCSQSQSIEKKHKPCCHNKAPGKLLVTTQEPSAYLGSNQLAKALTSTTEAKAVNILKINNDVEKFQNLGRNDVTFRNDHTNQSKGTNSSTTSQLKDKLFEEYNDYIAKRHSSTTTEVITTHAETTVKNFDVQIENEANNVETTTNNDNEKQYVYISKIFNPKLKTTTTPTTTTANSFLVTEEIMPPNQSNENYNQFLKVLQEYKELNDDVKILFGKSVNSGALDLPETPANNNDSISELDYNSNNKTLNLQHSSAEFSKVLTPVVLSTTNDKMVKIFETDYIKVVNGKRKLHSSEKRHNPQYLALVSNDPNNNIVTKEFTTTIPDSAKTMLPVKVLQVNHNFKEMKKVPFGILKTKEPEYETEKPDTIEDLEIDDQMQLNDGINSNEEQSAKKKDHHRFDDILFEYNMPYTVLKLRSGRPSYLEISNRHDWSPHSDYEAFNT